jgi:hypothetical protein
MAPDGSYTVRQNFTLPALADAAHDHVFDRSGINSGASNQRIERGRCQIDWMHPSQPSAAPSTGCAHCIDNIGRCHDLRFLLLDYLIDRLRGCKASVKRRCRAVANSPQGSAKNCARVFDNCQSATLPAGRENQASMWGRSGYGGVPLQSSDVRFSRIRGRGPKGQSNEILP